MKAAGFVDIQYAYQRVGFIDRKDRMRALEVFEEMKVAGVPPPDALFMNSWEGKERMGC